MFERPLQELFPLEAQAATADGPDELVQTAEHVVPTRLNVKKTRRTAAVVANKRIKLIY